MFVFVLSLLHLQWVVDHAHLGQPPATLGNYTTCLQPISCWTEPQWPVDNARLSSVSLVQLQWPVDNAHLVACG